MRSNGIERDDCASTEKTKEQEGKTDTVNEGHGEAKSCDYGQLSQRVNNDIRV
jgi:hypothetical protein